MKASSFSVGMTTHNMRSSPLAIFHSIHSRNHVLILWKNRSPDRTRKVLEACHQLCFPPKCMDHSLNTIVLFHIRRLRFAGRWVRSWSGSSRLLKPPSKASSKTTFTSGISSTGNPLEVPSYHWQIQYRCHRGILSQSLMRRLLSMRQAAMLQLRKTEICPLWNIKIRGAGLIVNAWQRLLAKWKLVQVLTVKSIMVSELVSNFCLGAAFSNTPLR